MATIEGQRMIDGRDNTACACLLSVIIPLHDEGESPVAVLAGLKTVFEKLGADRCEVILVDDGSINPVPVNYSCGLSRVHVLPHTLRRGSGAARKTGVQSARGEIIAWIDGDGTYDPQSLTLLLAQLKNADQVIGARSTDHGDIKWLRLAAKRMSFLLASLLWLRWIPDLNSGLRVFRRECLLKWIHLLPDGFSCTSTSTLAALNHGQRIVFVSIPYHSRTIGTGSKFHPIFDTLKLWRAILKSRMWRCGKDTINTPIARGVHSDLGT